MPTANPLTARLDGEVLAPMKMVASASAGTGAAARSARASTVTRVLLVISLKPIVI